MTSPLSDLSGWDSPIEPGGQARVPQVVWAAGKRGSVLVCRQYVSTRLIPCTAIGDGRQWTILHATEQKVLGLAVEEGKVLAEQPGERRRTRYLPTFPLSAMLETAAVTSATFIGPLLPGVGSCRPQVKLAPLITRFNPLLTWIVWQHNVSAARPTASSGRRPL
jgi:hypothetical protein